MGLLEDLKTKVLTADGAMGTLLYSYGIDFCYEELNVRKPEVIENIHKLYIEAGADVIQTNTYTANTIKLARYGIQDEYEALNRAGVEVAKRAAKNGEYVLGTIGGIRGIRKNEHSLDEIIESLVLQAKVLLDAGVDGLLLETFYDLEELETLVKTIRIFSDGPIVAQVSMHDPGVLLNGMKLNDALQHLERAGADVVGVNCRLGPYHTVKALENVELPKNSFLSAYPNASLLDVEEGKVVYESEAEYFGRAAVELRDEGVRLIGGCCGTTPEHIREVKKHLSDVLPMENKEVITTKEEVIREANVSKFEPLHEKVKKGRSIIVELDTPRHLETGKFLEGAAILQKAGADIVTMADNSLASPRVSNVAMGSILKYEKNVRALAHITCRDRNLIGLQSHLMGLDALGIHDILAVTGDPTKVGDFPGATSVYDVSSIELLQLIKKLNEGISFSGKPLRKKANFSVAAAFNPNVRVVERAIPRLEKKIEAGADYFITQPVYSKEKIIEIYEATKHLETPIYIGIMPLTSLRNSEFLHHEVPGIKLSDEVLERMKAADGDKERAQAEGVQIAKELIDTAASLFNGIYLITPFMRYDMSVELIHYIKELDEKVKGGSQVVETSH